MQTKISIAMATFNGEKHLSQQLETLGNQTLQPFELVICDDRSTDRTVEIVEKFREKLNFRVRLYENNKRLGYAENFLKAASLCKADWISFCDQDDVWSKDKLEIVSGYINGNPKAILISHPAELVDEDLNPTGEVAWASSYVVYDRFEMPFFQGGMGSGQTFRAFLVKKVSFEKRFRTHSNMVSAAPHDDWILRLSQCFGAACYIPEILVKRRRHAASVTAEKAPPASSQPKARKLSELYAAKISSDLLRRDSSLLYERSRHLRMAAKTSSPDVLYGLFSAQKYYYEAAKILDRRSDLRTSHRILRPYKILKLYSNRFYWSAGHAVGGWRSALRDLADLVA